MARETGRFEVDAAVLFREHPPEIRDPNKRAILELAGGPARTPRGALAITRWAPDPSAARTVGAAREVTSIDGPFAYPRVREGVVSWHVNFADPELFAFYGGPAFAQDELQVAEHPVLASVRGHMLAAGPAFAALTCDATGPTPVLVRGAERWCAIDTNPPLAAPDGIYGRALRRASSEVLAQAVTRLEDAPLSNILAIAAPQGGGRYTAAQIEDVLLTATTGFRAAVLESTGAASPGRGGARPRVRIHTGHWGTGVFGGNRVLMAAAQIVAARIVGIDELAYHSLGPSAVTAFERGAAVAAGIADGTSLDAVVADFEGRGFHWGTSDGN